MYGTVLSLDFMHSSRHLIVRLIAWILKYNSSVIVRETGLSQATARTSINSFRDISVAVSYTHLFLNKTSVALCTQA